MMNALIAGGIFAISLVVIMFEKAQRTIVAISGSAAMVVAGIAIGFYSEEEAVDAIDFETLGLLLGMMLLVALLEPTGVFQYIAIRAAQLSRGDPWSLMLLLGLGSSVTSMLLDNVTAVVMIAPVTIMVCNLMQLNAMPYLMVQGILSVMAGVSTSVGDPASILVASASGYTFNDFLLHSLPIVAIAILMALALFRYLFRHELSAAKTSRDILSNLRASDALHNVSETRRLLVVLALVISLFALQERVHMTPALVALSGSGIALLWVGGDIHEVLDRVEWSVIIFFVGLFVIVGGLEAAGILEAITRAVAGWISDPIILGIAIIWTVAMLSALVDNVPITIAMISILHELDAIGLDIRALWWALVLGAGFGGTATIIGSTANVLIVELSERTSAPITAKSWSRRGLPVAIVACSVASVLFVLGYSLLLE